MSVASSLDPSLLTRFQAAGRKVGWRPAEPPRSGAQIAHLHDAEARVERREAGPRFELWADPGPLGALLLVLEVAERGAPDWVRGVDGASPGFPDGALAAGWSTAIPPSGRDLDVDELVPVARYALA
jgi:hypothetical protein